MSLSLWHSNSNVISTLKAVFFTSQLSDDGETSDANTVPRVNLGAISRDLFPFTIIYSCFHCCIALSTRDRPPYASSTGTVVPAL